MFFLKTLTATLRLLAKRWLMLSAELKEIDATLDGEVKHASWDAISNFRGGCFLLSRPL